METEEMPLWMRKNLNDPAIARDVFHENKYELVPFLIQDGKKHPAAIICPGGGYNMICSYVEGEPFAKQLNALGISAVIVYYRVRELAAFPAPQDDLARAVREVHDRAEEWNLDMEGYSVWGSSAGGHLVSSFGTESLGYMHYGLPKPGAMVLIYPVITMGQYTHEGSRDNLLGKGASPELQRRTSVECLVTEQYPPTFVWCGDSDTCVDPRNSHMLAQALTEHNVPFVFREYPGIDHGVGLGTGTVCEPWFDEAVRFWRSQAEF